VEIAVGPSVNAHVGEPVGSVVGLSLGKVVGYSVGEYVKKKDGETVGMTVGMSVLSLTKLLLLLKLTVGTFVSAINTELLSTLGKGVVELSAIVGEVVGSLVENVIGITAKDGADVVKVCKAIEGLAEGDSSSDGTSAVGDTVSSSVGSSVGAIEGVKIAVSCSFSSWLFAIQSSTLDPNKLSFTFPWSLRNSILPIALWSFSGITAPIT
jgi:hypothetical protein